MGRGEGIHVFDGDGKELIDGMSGRWCTTLGFSEKRLVDATVWPMGVSLYDKVYNHQTHGLAMELAEELLHIAPAGMARVFFACSVSEANDMAVQMVWYYNNALGRPRKKKMIARHRSLHGSTCVSGSLTSLPNSQPDFDLPLPGFLHTAAAHFYDEGRPGETEEQFATRLAEELEALILAEGGAEHCAAFIAEPVMGPGGVVVPPRTYFEKIQAVLRKHDMLLIADETVCGLGRTGDMWGAQTFGMSPDIMTCGEALSSAYMPISAVMVSETIHYVFVGNSRGRGSSDHGFAHSAHPVSVMVALETLRIYAERDVLGHVRAVRPTFEDMMSAWDDSSRVGETRCVGLMGAVELVADKASRRPFDPSLMVGARVAKAARAQGLVIRAVGDTICLAPPLITTGAEVWEIFPRLSHALANGMAGL